MLNAQLKYKFGLRPAQRKELSSVLDIANKQLEIEMISNEHVYSASVSLKSSAKYALTKIIVFRENF